MPPQTLFHRNAPLCLQHLRDPASGANRQEAEPLRLPVFLHRDLFYSGLWGRHPGNMALQALRGGYDLRRTCGSAHSGTHRRGGPSGNGGGLIKPRVE